MGILDAPGLSIASADLRFAPPVSALTETYAKILTNTTDVNLTYWGDSTSAGQTPGQDWVPLHAADLGAMFPTHTVKTRFFADGSPGSFDAATTVTTGTGSRTITMWVAAVGGKTWQYNADVSRLEVAIAATNPDVLFIMNGHNENNTEAAAGVPNKNRWKAIGYIETVRQVLSQASVSGVNGGLGAAVVLMSQNPLTAYPGASERRADMYRWYARQRGYGFIDICKAFHDDGRTIAGTLVSGDGTHPTPAGYQVIRQTVTSHWRFAAKSQMLTALPSSFNNTPMNLAPDGALTNLDGSNKPATWTLSNVTATVDTTNMETGVRCLQFDKTTNGTVSFIEISLPNVVRGKTVTVAVRMSIPTGFNNNAGQVVMRDQTNTPGSEVWTSNDQWFWRIITYRFPKTATLNRVRIFIDPTTGSTASRILIDRVSAVYGDFPADVGPSFAQLDVEKQPLDSDLTAIAALTTTTYGRSLLTAADAAALRTAAGSVIGTDVQGYDADLAAIAALTTTTYGRSLLTLASRTALATEAAPTRLVLDINGWGSINGSPTRAAVGGGFPSRSLGWLLDPTSAEAVAGMVAMPAGWDTATATLVWASASGTGDAKFTLHVRSAASGASGIGVPPITAVAVGASGSAGNFAYLSLGTIDIDPSVIYHMALERNAADVLDTLAADAAAFALILDKAS